MVEGLTGRIVNESASCAVTIGAHPAACLDRQLIQARRFLAYAVGLHSGSDHDELVSAHACHIVVLAAAFFQVRGKRARMGRNPKTGEPATIDPRRVIGFRASQVMKARIDQALGD